MGRVTTRVVRARSILRRLDRFGVVSSTGDPLINLLNVEWSGLFARDVLTMSPRTHPELQYLFGSSTISVGVLVNAYEPALQEVVQELLREGYGRQPAYPAHEPLFCCALFGWDMVCATLLRHGANPLVRGEHGMLAIDCARSHGWVDVARRLDAHGKQLTADCHSEADGNLNEEFDKLFCPAGGSIDASVDEFAMRSLPRFQSICSELRIPEVDSRDLRTRRFESDYFFAKVPVLIRGGARSIPALRWTPQYLLAALCNKSGTCPARVSEHSPQNLSSIPYPDEYMPADSAAKAKREGGIRDVLEGDVGYFFEEVEAGSMLGQLLDQDVNFARVLPSLFQEDRQVLLPQFSFGQSGTGAPWHWHQDAFNICLVGERMWYLRSPAKAMLSSQPVSAGVPEASESFCALQKPGDIVYIPELWGHCVVNCTLSAAVSLEFGSL